MRFGGAKGPPEEPPLLPPGYSLDRSDPDVLVLSAHRGWWLPASAPGAPRQRTSSGRRGRITGSGAAPLNTTGSRTFRERCWISFGQGCKRAGTPRARFAASRRRREGGGLPEGRFRHVQGLRQARHQRQVSGGVFQRVLSHEVSGRPDAPEASPRSLIVPLSTASSCLPWTHCTPDEAFGARRTPY
jgi:hypothetical protein